MLDILAQTTMPASEIVRDAHNFYSDAFGDLLMVAAIFMAFLTIAIALIGIVLPLWFEHQRRQKFELSKQEVLADINAAKSNFEKEHKKLLADIRKTEGDLRKAIERKVQSAAADSYMGIAFAAQNPYFKLHNAILAAQAAVRAQREAHFSTVLTHLAMLAAHANTPTRSVLSPSDVQDLIDSLEELKRLTRLQGWSEKYDLRIEAVSVLLMMRQVEAGKDKPSKQNGDEGTIDENNAGDD